MIVDVPPAQLAGTAEVAKELSCPKQQIHALRRRKDFPQPVCKLAATPVWDLRDIRIFKERWRRRNKVLTAAS